MTRPWRWPLAAVVLCLLRSLTSAPVGASPPGAESGPAPAGELPTRVLLGFAGNPSRSMAVTWRTARPVANPVAQIAPEMARSDLASTATSVSGEGQALPLADGRTVGQYRAVFAGLEPGRRYVYRVGDGQSWSEWNTFTTARDEPAPFRFIYLGDVQNEIRSVWSRVVRSAYAAAPDARFIAYAGDLLAEGYDDRLWGEWCDGLGFIGASVPALPVPGNHDLHRAPGNPPGALAVSPLWRAHFTVPDNGPAAPGDRIGQTYSLDYQGARLIALDVNAWANDAFEPGERERVKQATLEWLTQTLAQNPNRWTIVLQHQAIHSIAKERDYAEMRAALVPLYDRYGVDLVLQGHDHAYGRTRKLAANKVVPDAARGTIYAISVSGAKMYEIHRANRELMATLVAQKQLYQVVSISPSRLSFDAYGADGVRVDAFDLRKTGRGPSLYVDRERLPPARRSRSLPLK
jgi:3',5'-cyclic AMP phosphodiesterase CpdA